MPHIMKNALITTTIRIPYNIEAYAKDIAEHGPKDTAIIIAGDKKTPEQIEFFCLDLQEKYSVPVVYLNPKDQDRLFPAYSKFLPWNCPERRNLAILYAYHNGAEIIASVDDDNFWEGQGYFKGHGEFKTNKEAFVGSTSDGWFNVCSFLAEKRGKCFYPRGYGMDIRKTSSNAPTFYDYKNVKCVVNAGLWIGEPDIDAVTRLASAPNVINYVPEESFVLDRGTKCPFNTQNTAFHRSIVPAYCQTHGTGRYSDIIASYIVKRIADHLDDYVRFGIPIVHQIRNNHDVWKDLENERIGMQLTDQFVNWLYEIELTGKEYFDCIRELIPALEEKFRAANLNTEQDVFMHNVVTGYKEWMKYT